MGKHRRTSLVHKEHRKSKEFTLKYIRRKVEKGTGSSFYQLKKNHSEEELFFIALKHVTTTKKALCVALKLNVENCCRYKRSFEKVGLLVQSTDEIICPFTKHKAHLISTNPKEFKRLTKTNQLSLFK